MKKRIGIGAATAAMALGTWAASAVPANASSIEHKDPTVHAMDMARATRSNARPKSSPLLSYHGGAISSDPHVYVVYWGSQWGTQGTDGASRMTLSNDTLGVAPYQQAYLQGIRSGAQWGSSTTQYCQGVATGSTSCPSTAQHVGYPANSPLLGVWADNASPAPSQPTQSQLAQEAVRAAGQFPGFNPATDQIVVSTFSHNNASGFGTQYCAWHSSTTNSVGQRIAYTNAPYMPDAGASCGANTFGGTLDGVSIVGGHEFAETITDMFPNGGWLDSGGSENADKCAWKNLAKVSLATGSYAMQPLWSNSANACVMN